MPELPEVEALAEFLREEAIGHTVTRVDVLAINALKTFAPPIDSLAGWTIAAVGRHGKFLDLRMTKDGADDLHFVVHLARAGWLRWSTSLADKPPRQGRNNPLAVRIHLGDGVGFDLTEAGTQKRLACYLVARSADIPGVSRLGPDPLGDDFTAERLKEILQTAGRAQLKGVLTEQGRIAGIGNAYSDEILHAARMSPFKPANSSG